MACCHFLLYLFHLLRFISFHVTFVPRTWTASSFPLPLEMTPPQGRESSRERSSEMFAEAAKAGDTSISDEVWPNWFDASLGYGWMG